MFIIAIIFIFHAFNTRQGARNHLETFTIQRLNYYLRSNLLSTSEESFFTFGTAIGKHKFYGSDLCYFVFNYLVLKLRNVNKIDDFLFNAPETWTNEENAKKCL